MPRGRKKQVLDTGLKSDKTPQRDADGFMKAGGFNATPVIDIREDGKVFQAHYLKSKLIESDKLENGRAILHEFMTEQGELVGVWGSGQLDYRLKDIGERAPGALTRIKYLGKGVFKNKKGKKLPVHNYDVEYNPDKTINPMI